MSTFKQVIQNEAELRAILGYAGEAAQNKVLTEIDEICRAFIETSRFMLLGSTDADDNMDVCQSEIIFGMDDFGFHIGEMLNSLKDYS